MGDPGLGSHRVGRAPNTIRSPPPAPTLMADARRRPPPSLPKLVRKSERHDVLRRNLSHYSVPQARLVSIKKKKHTLVQLSPPFHIEQLRACPQPRQTPVPRWSDEPRPAGHATLDFNPDSSTLALNSSNWREAPWPCYPVAHTSNWSFLGLPKFRDYRRPTPGRPDRTGFKPQPQPSSWDYRPPATTPGPALYAPCCRIRDPDQVVPLGKT